MPRLRSDISCRTLMRSTSLLWILVGGLAGCAWFARQATSVYMAVDSKFKPSHVKIELLQTFVQRNRNRVQIWANFKVDKAMGSPLPAPIDGDLHFAGRSPQIALPVVGEVANAAKQKEAVDLVHAAEGSGRPLKITGVFRIWPEHAASSKAEQGKHVDPLDSDTPDHVFEIHPITRINGVSTLSSFTPVDGFMPGGADKTFEIWEKARCTISYTGDKIAILTETGLYNDVEFIMQITGPQQKVSDGRFVPASALDMDGKMQVQNLRLVFAKDTPPDRIVKRLKVGDRLHVYGMPRISFEEVARRLEEQPRKGPDAKQPLPYEVTILGVYPK
jgi:hypothetical protein